MVALTAAISSNDGMFDALTESERDNDINSRERRISSFREEDTEDDALLHTNMHMEPSNAYGSGATTRTSTASVGPSPNAPLFTIINHTPLRNIESEEDRTTSRTDRRNASRTEISINPALIIPFLSSTLQTTVMKIIAVFRAILTFGSQFILTTFTNHMSTKQLYTVSIVLLCVHIFVQKLLDYLPYLLTRGYLLLMGEDASSISAASSIQKIDLREFVHTDSKWIESEIEAMERILEQILNSGAQSMGMDINMNKHTHVSSTFGDTGTILDASAATDTSSLPMKLMSVSSHIFETPITSIMLPTTILSIFLLMTMTLFLMFHIAFQAILYVSYFRPNDSNGNDGRDLHRHRHPSTVLDGYNGFGSGILGVTLGGTGFSPHSIALFLFITLLILDNLIPWIAFGMGIYLSFSVGGMTWFIFTAATYLICFCLRRCRSRILDWVQDNHGPRLD